MELTIDFFSSDQNVQEKLESKLKEVAKVNLYTFVYIYKWFSSQNRQDIGE